MAFLDTNIVEQLKGYFDKISEPVEIVSFLDDSQKSLELKAFLTEIDEISDKVNYTEKSFGEQGRTCHRDSRYTGNRKVFRRKICKV